MFLEFTPYDPKEELRMIQLSDLHFISRDSETGLARLHFSLPGFVEREVLIGASYSALFSAMFLHKDKIIISVQ